jgi:hypothetical protein
MAKELVSAMTPLEVEKLMAGLECHHMVKSGNDGLVRCHLLCTGLSKEMAS